MGNVLLTYRLRDYREERKYGSNRPWTDAYIESEYRKGWCKCAVCLTGVPRVFHPPDYPEKYPRTEYGGKFCDEMHCCNRLHKCVRDGCCRKRKKLVNQLLESLPKN